MVCARLFSAKCFSISPFFKVTKVISLKVPDARRSNVKIITTGDNMKRIAAFLLLAVISLASLPAFARKENKAIGENQSEAKRAMKQQQKYNRKQAKRQQKAMKKYQKAQRRAAKRQQHQQRHHA